MANEKAPPQFDPPQPLFSTWIGVIMLFALFGMIALVLVAASPRGDHYEKTRAKARLEKLRAARTEADKTLTTYGWVDKTKGVARIPINEAQQLVVVERAHKQPTMAGPIATPAPAGPQTTAPTTATAAPSPTAAPGASPKAVSVDGAKSEIRGQPTGAANPAPVQPGTQPGASATPAASAPPASGQPGSTSPPPSPTAPGTPLPVPGKP